MGTVPAITNYRILSLAYEALLHRYQTEWEKPHGKIREFRLQKLKEEIDSIHEMVLQMEKNKQEVEE